MGEIAHHMLEFTFRHLAMGNADACLRHHGGEFFSHGFNFIVEKVDLSAALQFTQAGLADQAPAVWLDEGLDGQAPLRGGGDHREVADALQ